MLDAKKAELAQAKETFDKLDPTKTGPALAQAKAMLEDAKAGYATALEELNNANIVANKALTELDSAKATLETETNKLNDLLAKLDSAKKAHDEYIARQKAIETGVVVNNSKKNIATDKSETTSKKEEKKPVEQPKIDKEIGNPNEEKKNEVKEENAKVEETKEETSKGSIAPIAIGILATSAIAGIGFVIYKKKKEKGE